MPRWSSTRSRVAAAVAGAAILAAVPAWLMATLYIVGFGIAGENCEGGVCERAAAWWYGASQGILCLLGVVLATMAWNRLWRVLRTGNQLGYALKMTLVTALIGGLWLLLLAIHSASSGHYY